MQQFCLRAIVFCIGIYVLAGCKKGNDAEPANNPEFAKIKKVIGAVLWDHFPTLTGYASDSTIYSYNSNDRISHISYYGRTETGGVIKKHQLETDLTYDQRGNVQRIMLQGDPAVLEKEIIFQYNAFDTLVKATITFRSNGSLIRENDRVVFTYVHYGPPYNPAAINGQAVTDEIFVQSEYFGNRNALINYLTSWESGGAAYSYYLNKDNIPLQIWKTHFYTSIVHENYRYDIRDSNIVAIRQHTNDLLAQLPPSYINKFERTDIPNINLQIAKNIFGKHFWISNIGIMSPFHAMDVSTFAQSLDAGSASAFYFSYQVDKDARTVRQLYRDQFGAYQPLATYYFH